MTLPSSDKPSIAVVGSDSMIGSRFCELAKEKLAGFKSEFIEVVEGILK